MNDKIILNVYDFDKTIYNGDSTIDFFCFCVKKNKKIFLLLPSIIFNFILFKIKIIPKIKFKERFFSFLGKIKNVDDYVKEFWNINFYKIKNWFKEDNNYNKVIISASPEFLLKPLVSKFDVLCIIASKVDKNSGKFISKNCYGSEKVNRLNDEYNNYQIKNFYTDSHSDIYLARISEKSYLIKKGKISNWYLKEGEK